METNKHSRRDNVERIQTVLKEYDHSDVANFILERYKELETWSEEELEEESIIYEFESFLEFEENNC